MNEILSIFNDYAGVISFVTLLATLFSIWYAWRNNKDNIRQQIESKEAELESIYNTYFNELTSFMGCPEKTQMKVRKDALEKEIAKLKRRL
ncbi:MAG: hypothetical protein IJA95_11730 [Bacteroidaceae bacterium]|nr:hypothetical protein [Bacteroidaceae bacterium]